MDTELVNKPSLLHLIFIYLGLCLCLSLSLSLSLSNIYV